MEIPFGEGLLLHINPLLFDGQHIDDIQGQMRLEGGGGDEVDRKNEIGIIVN